MAHLPRLTARGWALAAVSLGLYFFANQTQVGWLYLLSALAAGLLLACAWLPAAMLRGLTVTRRVDGSTLGHEIELHAGRPVSLALEWRQRGGVPALQVQGVETLGFAPPSQRAQTFYVDAVPARGTTRLELSLTAARRGWYPFGPLPVSTRAPFGFFAARRVLHPQGPDGVLVFPEYREIKQLALLDRQPAVANSLSRLGAGGEFAGVREHRPGDPRRHIHWRSTARAGRLIVKEFAEERQPGLTLALDLRAALVVGGEDENTFEVAVKVAASLAHYAHSRGLPVSLVVNSQQWPVPPGALSWWGLMGYLARVQAGGEDSLASALLSAPLTSSLAVVMPAPDTETASALVGLRQTGVSVLAVVVDPGPFVHDVALARQAKDWATGLQGLGVSAVVAGGDWEEALAEIS